MLKCNSEGPTIVHVTKLYHTSDAQEFRAFGRVMSGTVRRGQAVKVLGEGYSLEDEEDMVSATVDAVLIDESRWVASSRHGVTRDSLTSADTTWTLSELGLVISCCCPASTLPSPRPPRS